jgi:hypothetical protein
MTRPEHVQKLIDGHQAQMAYLRSLSLPYLTRALRCSRDEVRAAIAEFVAEREEQLQRLEATANYNCAPLCALPPVAVVPLLHRPNIAQAHHRAHEVRRQREDIPWQLTLRALERRIPKRIRELHNLINNRGSGEILREQQRRRNARLLQECGDSCASLNRVLSQQGSPQIDFGALLR